MRRGILCLFIIYGVFAAPVDDDAVQEFENGNLLFSADLYKELVKENRDNLVFSPLSLDTILSLTYEGAGGETADELVSGLHLPNTNEKIQRAYRQVLPKLHSSSDDLTLSSANRLYIAENVLLKDEFESVAANIFRAGVGRVDFAENAAAAEEINSWVEEETSQKITNLIEPSEINERTRIVLVNTLYLSGQWETPFEMHPKLREFYVGKYGALQIPMMRQQQYFNYWENENLNARFLELPLRGANISMVIALPNEIDGLSGLEDNIEELLFQPQPYNLELVEIYLPRFSIQTKTQFVPYLQNLGIRQVFSGNADLRGMALTDRQLFITDVIQKTYLNVTEGGIEAAAATEGIKSLLPENLSPTVTYDANRPFLFYITQNGIILFSGRYLGPPWACVNVDTC